MRARKVPTRLFHIGPGFNRVGFIDLGDATRIIQLLLAGQFSLMQTHASFEFVTGVCVFNLCTLESGFTAFHLCLVIRIVYTQ